MCDNLDIKGKRGIAQSGQSLNTVSGVMWHKHTWARSYHAIYAPSKERDHVVLHVLRTDQVSQKTGNRAISTWKAQKRDKNQKTV